ncbi:MAG: helix-turn-helix transcriptional regulator [Cellvibrionaceae bacterium]
MQFAQFEDVDKAKGITQINTRILTENNKQAACWKKIKLAEKKGQTEFDIAKICKDICLTRSRCLFRRDYHACIDYDEQTTLLVFGLKGYSSFRYANNHRLYTVGPGDIWLVSTNKEQLFRSTPAGQENEMIVIKYASHRLYDTLENQAALGSSRIIRLGHQASSDNSVINLINNDLKTMASRLIAESQALALLARWLEPANNKVNAIHSQNQSALSSSELLCLQEIVETLTSDLINPPSLNELAKQANMSHTKLNRCFKKAYGTTVYSWLRLYRLESAARYLSGDQNSITDIAFQCGFSSASHFAHAFKQYYKCSPAEYREQAFKTQSICSF